MLSIEKQLLFLISSTEVLNTKILFEIYNLRGVSQQVIRNCLSSLKKGGYINNMKHSNYSITEYGLMMLETTNKKSNLLEKKWDGNWQVLIFEIPELYRKKRDGFRKDLLRLGFGLLYKSTYITPWDKSNEVINLIKQYELNDMTKIINGHFLFNQVTTKDVSKIWSIDVLNELYGEKRKWFYSEFKPHLEKSISNETNKDLFLFIHFLELGEVISELSLTDPMLPIELLPDNWIGKICFEELNSYLYFISNSIEQKSKYFTFVRQFLNSYSGLVKKLDN